VNDELEHELRIFDTPGSLKVGMDWEEPMAVEVRVSVRITAPSDAACDEVLRALASWHDEITERFVSITEFSRELVR
jgi:hypothetical protein